MKNLSKKLSYALYFVLAVVVFQSCNNNTKSVNKKLKQKRAFTVILSTGNGWSWTQTRMEVDSVQMESVEKAFVWVNGTKMSIVANEISIYSNNR